METVKDGLEKSRKVVQVFQFFQFFQFFQRKRGEMCILRGRKAEEQKKCGKNLEKGLEGENNNFYNRLPRILCSAKFEAITISLQN
jgi:hypothetical protein